MTIENRPELNSKSDPNPASLGSLEGSVSPQREASILNSRTLLFAALALLGLIVAVHLLAGVLFGYFSIINPIGLALPPAENQAAAQPPEPALQVNPVQELQQVRSAERANLGSYGWVDRDAGIVRIPIERAMELIAERGLPVRSAPTTESAGEEGDNSGFGFATPEP